MGDNPNYKMKEIISKDWSNKNSAVSNTDVFDIWKKEYLGIKYRKMKEEGQPKKKIEAIFKDSK